MSRHRNIFSYQLSFTTMGLDVYFPIPFLKYICYNTQHTITYKYGEEFIIYDKPIYILQIKGYNPFFPHTQQLNTNIV